jgi:hypothetical protein
MLAPLVTAHVSKLGQSGRRRTTHNVKVFEIGRGGSKYLRYVKPFPSLKGLFERLRSDGIRATFCTRIAVTDQRPHPEMPVIFL